MTAGADCEGTGCMADGFTFLASVSLSSVATAVIHRYLGALGWLHGFDLALMTFGIFCGLLATLLAVLPRVINPSGPFGNMFGLAAVLANQDESERFRICQDRAPKLRRECLSISKRLLKVYAEEQAKLPRAPTTPTGPDGQPTAEQIEYNRATAKAFDDFTALYHSTWRRRVEPLLSDAKAMHFGPPFPDRFGDALPPGHRISPDRVRDYAVILGQIGDGIPETYSATFHKARAESLRRLRRDGIRAAVDMRQYLKQQQEREATRTDEIRIAIEAEFSQAQAAGQPIQSQGTPEWRARVAFSTETEQEFLQRFGADFIRFRRELLSFGIADEAMERMFAFHSLHLSFYEMASVPAILEALCIQIPYDD